MLKHQRTLSARVSLRDEPNHLNFVLRECWVSQSSPAHYTADQKRRREMKQQIQAFSLLLWNILTQNTVSLSLGFWPATAESLPSPNNCLRTFSRLSLCIYMYTALSAPSSVFCYLAWTTATQPLSKSASWTSSPAQVQFRWSQYLVMTGNWWQTWDVELGPEGSRVTPLSLPCPD